MGKIQDSSERRSEIERGQLRSFVSSDQSALFHDTRGDDVFAEGSDCDGWK
jgi:hypothetical protein